MFFYVDCKDNFATGSYYACKLGCIRGKNIDQEPADIPTVARKSTPPEDVRINSHLSLQRETICEYVINFLTIDIKWLFHEQQPSFPFRHFSKFFYYQN